MDGATYTGIDGVVAGDTVPARVTREGETWRCDLTRDGAVIATDAVTPAGPTCWWC